jgi:hypothetical protein
VQTDEVMNYVTKTTKELAPIIGMAISSFLAILIGTRVGFDVASEGLREDSLGFGKLAAPLMFGIIFLPFFFYAWTPIYGITLLCCASVPATRKASKWWVWSLWWGIWLVSLLPFYFSIKFIRGSPVTEKYWPF